MAALRAALLLAICLITAEATVRVVATRVSGVRRLAEPTGTRVDDPEDFAGFQRAFADHLMPHREWRGSPCNALGFHDDDPAHDFPASGFRVVALGDSFAFGSVPQAQTELGVAETLLRHARTQHADPSRAAALPPFAIENLGVPASGVADYGLVYDFVGRGLDPDLVLVQVYLGNDPLDYADASRFGHARGWWPRSWLLTFVRRARALLRARPHVPSADVDAAPPAASSASAHPAVAWSDDHPELVRPAFSDDAFADIVANELHVLAKPGTDREAPRWERFEAALGRLLDRITADGTKVALVLAPSRLQVHPDELRGAATRVGVAADSLDADLPNHHLHVLAQRRGVPVIDTTDELRRAAARGERLYLPNDTHWNVRGNAVAGAELALALARRGLVPTSVAAPSPAATAVAAVR